MAIDKRMLDFKDEGQQNMPEKIFVYLLKQRER